MRLFVALEAEGHVKSEILEVVESLSSVHKNARWVAPENLHFTLKFLGDVDDSRLDDVIAAIGKAIVGVKPFTLRVHGLGYFGSRRSARVVWVGCHEGREEMVKLASELEKNLAAFRKEEREPSPHLTICRPDGDTSMLVEDVEKMKQRDFGMMEVSSVVLKKSTLTPKGAVYEDVKSFSLGASFLYPFKLTREAGKPRVQQALAASHPPQGTS